MAEVTEGDRERAREVVEAVGPEDAYVDEWVFDGNAEALRNAVATALAEERKKARAPFLEVMRQIPPDSPELRWVADQIQRAADGVTA